MDVLNKHLINVVVVVAAELGGQLAGSLLSFALSCIFYMHVF